MLCTWEIGENILLLLNIIVKANSLENAVFQLLTETKIMISFFYRRSVESVQISHLGSPVVSGSERNDAGG